jgi:hypothetical protein
MSNSVNHPDHYQGQGIECIDAMVAAFGPFEVASFCKLNAFKYIWRCLDKGKTVEDIDKAIWYLERYKGFVSEENLLYDVKDE